MRQLTRIHGLSRSPVFGLHPRLRRSVRGPCPECVAVVPVAGEGDGSYGHDSFIRSAPGPVPFH